MSDGYVDLSAEKRRPGKLAIVLTAVCFVAAVILGSFLVSNAARSRKATDASGGGAATSTSATPSTSQTAVTPSPSSSTPTASAPEEGTDHHGTAKRPDQAVAMVAAQFVDAWLLRKPPAARLAALRAVASEFLATSLATTDLNALPASSRYGMPKLTAWTELSAQYRVSLRNGQTVDVTLTPDGPGWKVITVEPGPSTPSNPTPSTTR
ncbi:hypothetical protein ACFV9C_42120 [Kribbella sp. NPDC059898]|uniref:hypothetical protein n=1 Tax=Kribbella sp. NPDC059898 TaxID=3346995 RepID=UPI00366529CC